MRKLLVELTSEQIFWYGLTLVLCLVIFGVTTYKVTGLVVSTSEEARILEFKKTHHCAHCMVRLFPGKAGKPKKIPQATSNDERQRNGG